MNSEKEENKEKKYTGCEYHRNSVYDCICPICHGSTKCFCYVMDGRHYGFIEPGDHTGIYPG